MLTLIVQVINLQLSIELSRAVVLLMWILTRWLLACGYDHLDLRLCPARDVDTTPTQNHSRVFDVFTAEIGNREVRVCRCSAPVAITCTFALTR